MCEPSKVTDDWVTKGCHIHVDGIELNIFTNHTGGIGFRSVFSSSRPEQVASAIKVAYRDCLSDPFTRNRWIQRLDMARVFMLDYPGQMRDLANGRMFDFKMIRVAIERWGAENGNP